MAFSELECARLRKVLDAFMAKHRPPPHIRSKVDLGFELSGQSVEIFEVRPAWQGAPGETIKNHVAKATFNKSRATWKVFWQRADQKWHAYPPVPEVGSIEQFLGLVAEDEHACFFG